MGYYDSEDVIEERDGYRVRLELDDSPEAPYNDGATPIFQLDSSHRDYYGAYNAEAFNKQAEPYLDAFQRFEHTGQQLEIFERYLRIFHGAVKVQTWNVGVSREYGYLAFDTAEWRETVGAPVDRLKDADYLDEVRSWATGEVFGYIVERNVSYTKTWEDGTEEHDAEWMEITDGACWGFYGRDWAKQAAKDALTDALEWHKQKDGN